MKRYHPLLVSLHWILALMIGMGLIMGGNVLSATPNADPQKLLFLKIHMSAGMVILVLTLVRLLTRLLTEKPPAADTGNRALNILGAATHYVFYLIIIAMAGSGLAIANMAGLIDIVFGASGTPLPESFDEFAPRMAHGAISTLLTLLIAGHVAAFAYHQFVLEDKLFSRMWFGARR